MRLTFIELPAFTSRWQREKLGDEKLQELQAVILEHPGAGDSMPRTGGLRKIRLAPRKGAGKGKSFGYRVIYGGGDESDRADDLQRQAADRSVYRAHDRDSRSLCVRRSRCTRAQRFPSRKPGHFRATAGRFENPRAEMGSRGQCALANGPPTDGFDQGQPPRLALDGSRRGDGIAD